MLDVGRIAVVNGLLLLSSSAPPPAPEAAPAAPAAAGVIGVTESSVRQLSDESRKKTLALLLSSEQHFFSPALQAIGHPSLLLMHPAVPGQRSACLPPQTQRYATHCDSERTRNGRKCQSLEARLS